MNRPTFAALAASLLLLLTSNPLAAQDDQTRTFQGEIEVREVGVVVEPPEGRSLGSLRPEEILVFEDGTPRPVIKAEPLRPGQGTSPWSFVLYFDRVLAGPETTRGAALVLARQAERLTGLGTVEIVVAGPEPRVELAATRDPRGLSAALSEISGQARREGDRSRDTAQPAAPDPAVLRRQLDRLTAFLASRPGPGAHALFLIADGYLPSPAEAALLADPDSSGVVPPETAAAALRESSRVLAGYGWVTFAGPFRESSGEGERRQMADLERIRVQAGGSKHTGGVPPVIPMPPPDAGPRGDARVAGAGVFSQQDSAPLMALAQPTAGTVLGMEEQVGPAIDGLSRRWRIWYQAPETLDGRLRRVEVRLPAGGPLQSPRWVRSATPEGLAGARARLLAGGSSRMDGHLPFDATLDGGTLKLRVPPAAGTAAGPVRITLAFDSSAEVRHVTLPEVGLEKAWEHKMEVQPPAGTRRIAVLVEDLVHGRWGGTAVVLP